MIDVRIPVLVYLTCFSLCVVSILGLAAEKKKQEAKDNPEAKAKAKQKKKKGKTPETADTESVFEKLQNEQDAQNGEAEHETAA